MIGRLTQRSGIRVLEMDSRKPSVKSFKGTDPPGKGILWVPWKLQGSACVSDDKSLSVWPTILRACGGFWLCPLICWSLYPGQMVILDSPNFDCRAYPSSSSVLPLVPCSNSSSQSRHSLETSALISYLHSLVKKSGSSPLF